MVCHPNRTMQVSNSSSMCYYLLAYLLLKENKTRHSGKKILNLETGRLYLSLINVCFNHTKSGLKFPFDTPTHHLLLLPAYKICNFASMMKN